MLNNSFAIGQAFSESWLVFKKNTGFLIAATAVTLLATGVIEFARSSVVSDGSDTAMLIGTLLSVAGFILEFLVSAGWVAVSVKLLRGDKVTMIDLFDSGDVLLRYVLASFVYGAAVLGVLFIFALVFILPGMFLLPNNLVQGVLTGAQDLSISSSYIAAFAIGALVVIIPTVYVGIRGGFFPYAVIVEHIGPIAAFKRSFEMTRGVFWKLFIWSLLMNLLTLVSLVPLFLGLFVTIPLSSIGKAWLYAKLAKTKTA